MLIPALALALALALPLATGCGGDPGTSDAGVDGTPPGDQGGPDTGIDGARPDSGPDGAGDGTGGDAVDLAGPDGDAGPGDGSGGDGPDALVGCLAGGRSAGERYPQGDECNFCVCVADGSETCTTRTCAEAPGACTYAGVDHAYAERFPSTDGCNECVCAASGLACTRRTCPGALEEGAILLESLDDSCGPEESFTPQAVLDGLPVSELTAPFLYQRDRPVEQYPETLPDTEVTFRVVYDGGFAVCRIPAPGQEALDLEVRMEWITADGAFDEGFHTYLRRNAGGFVDAWFVFGVAPPGGLEGTYDPACLDPNGFGFDATINADGTASGSATKVCETDILLDIGTWSHAP